MVFLGLRWLVVSTASAYSEAAKHDRSYFRDYWKDYFVYESNKTGRYICL